MMCPLVQNSKIIKKWTRNRLLNVGWTWFKLMMSLYITWLLGWAPRGTLHFSGREWHNQWTFHRKCMCFTSLSWGKLDLVGVGTSARVSVGRSPSINLLFFLFNLRISIWLVRKDRNTMEQQAVCYCTFFK